MKYIGTPLVRDIRRSMFDYGPKMYEELNESVAIIETEADEFELLNGRIADVIAQFNVDTATWGLLSYEYDIGIPPQDGSTFENLEENNLTFEDIQIDTWSTLITKYPPDIDERRETIKAKLRGVGVATPQLIKNVVETYSNGEVEVLELNSAGTITIKFIGEYGVPAKISEIQKLLREIVPAHLEIVYEYKYVTYNQSKGAYGTYDEMKATNYKYEQLLSNVI